MFTIDDLNDNITPNYLAKKINSLNKNIINFISHPKLLSKNSFNQLKFLIEQNYNFINLKELHDEIV